MHIGSLPVYLSLAGLSYASFAVFLGLAVTLQVVGLAWLLVFRYRPLHPLRRDGKLPRVTIIKPCFNNQDNERENFEHFFQQDYPGSLEVIFVVGSESVPIVPIIRDYLRRYPEKGARLLVSQSRIAHWNKVNSLYDAHGQSTGDIVIWSDSDVVVRSNYVSQMVGCLQQPGVSVVTTPQYDFRADNFATALKTLANNCDDATFMMAYDLFNRRKIVALGHSLGFWRGEFDSFGDEAWQILSRFLGDDLALPYLFSKHGKRVVFRNIFCPVQYSGKKLSQVIEQKRRWVMCQKQVVGNRFIYLTGCLFYPELPALLMAVLSGFSAPSLLIFMGATLLRIFTSFLFEGLFLGSVRMSLRYFWTVPLWDLMQAGFVLDGFFRDFVELNGKKFAIEDRFFLRPLEETNDRGPF